MENIVYKKYNSVSKIVSLMLIISFSLLIIILNKTSYSKYNTIALYNKELSVIVPISYTNNIKTSKYIVINNERYHIKSISYGEIEKNNNIFTQELKLSTNYKSDNINELIDITFYYNKQKILKKIVGGIFND